GFWGACSTYGAFSYLKYGEMRLFSQLAQDCELKVGKVLWVAGHSGPETAEDSRTHFGIFETGVTQLFPDGAVTDVHPWEYNEVPVVIAAALRAKAPIVALHLTRPSVDIPDRAALGMPSHFAAARGAYVLRPYRAGAPKMGMIFVQGTMTTANLVKILPQLDEAGLNVKIVAAISPQLFALQDEAYRASVATPAERLDAMVISNRARRSMRSPRTARRCGTPCRKPASRTPVPRERRPRPRPASDGSSIRTTASPECRSRVSACSRSRAAAAGTRCSSRSSGPRRPSSTS